MEDRRTLRLNLQSGESRQLLLEAGSLLLVLDGCIELAGAPQWLAETCLRPRQILGPEEVHRVERGGWFSLAAPGGAQCALIAPDSASFWTRIGRCLEQFGRSATNH